MNADRTVERGQVGSISGLDGRASLIHISEVKEGGTIERHLEIVGGKWPRFQIGREGENNPEISEDTGKIIFIYPGIGTSAIA